MLSEADPTVRFTDRVEYYAAYRPSYPDAVIETLRREAELAQSAAVVDVGSGTGLSSELFLRHGYTVYGVEPNPSMRRAAERLLRQYPAFHSVDGRAEATTLPGSSAGVVVCASALHWFDLDAARAEFRRILQPHGLVAVMSNGRVDSASDFMRSLSDLFRSCGRRSPAHVNRAERIAALLGGSPRSATAPNRELVDFRVLSGRLLSYSSIPLPGEPGHANMIRELRLLFDAAAENGRVWYEGEVRLHWGRLM